MIYSLHFSVAARKIVWLDWSLGYTSLLLGNQQTTVIHPIDYDDLDVHALDRGMPAEETPVVDHDNSWNVITYKVTHA